MSSAMRRGSKTEPVEASADGKNLEALEEEEVEQELDDNGLPSGPLRMTAADVTREIEESLARTADADAKVKAQEEFVRRIEHIVAEGVGDDDADGPAAHLADTNGFPTFLEQASTHERVQHLNAQVLNKTQREQEFLQERHQDNHTELNVAFERHRQHLEAKEKASEAYQKRRHGDLAYERKMKAQIVHQRKCVQERTYLEYMRAQDRHRAEITAKMQQGEERSASVPARGKGEGTASQGSNGDSDSFLAETAVMHARNNATMESARQFLAFGQHLSDKHCQKLLGPSGRQYVDRLLGKPVSSNRFSTKKRTMTIDDGFTFQRSASNRFSSSADTDRLLPSAEPASPSSERPRKNWATLRSKHKAVAALAGSWEERRERCVKSLEESAVRDDERWAMQSEKLDNSRGRKNGFDKERTQLLHAASEVWVDRERTAKLRRQQSLTSSDADLVKRHAACDARRAEIESKAEEARQQSSSQRHARTSEALSRSQTFAEKQRCREMERLSDKDRQTIIFYGLRFEEFENRAGAKGHAEKVQESLARKAEADEEFRAKARAEIQVKTARQEANVTQQPKLGLEQRCKERMSFKRSESKRKEKEKEGFFVTAADDDEEAEGDAGAAPAPRASLVAEAATSPSSGWTASLLASPSSLLTSTPGGERERIGTAESFFGGRSILDSEIQELESSSKAFASRRRKVSAVSHFEEDEDAGSEEERELNTAIERKGATWLKELRRKNEDMNLRLRR